MIEIKRSWKDGPLRECSDLRERGSWTPYATGGFSGSYICDKCHNPSVGLYRTKSGVWVCASCKA